jgi:hypothetical protein
MSNEVAQSPNGMMAIIERMAASPDIDVEKLERMLALQERMMAKQSEIDFTEALTRMKPKLPVIQKNGAIVFVDKNNVERKTPHARYEDIQEAIAPHLVEEGFSLSFDTEAVANTAPIIKCTLSHRGGHSKTISMPLPLDTSGSKNNLQAMGSTILYGKRYLVGMMLDLVIKGVDNDGKSLGVLDNDKAVEIDMLITKTGTNKDSFLKLMGTDDVRNILAKDYDTAMRFLKMKEGAKKNG